MPSKKKSGKSRATLAGVALFVLVLAVALFFVLRSSSSPSSSSRVTNAQASQLILAWYKSQSPDLNPAVTAPVNELTTPEIWNRLGVQVFQVSADIHQYDTFLLRKGSLTPMGIGVGGAGVISLEVADLNGDGQPELLYTYSFGSGLHRSRLALYSPALPGNGMLESNTMLFNEDMILAKVDDRTVNLKATLPGSQNVLFAQVSLKVQGGEQSLDLSVFQGIPTQLQNDIRSGFIPN